MLKRKKTQRQYTRDSCSVNIIMWSILFIVVLPCTTFASSFGGIPSALLVYPRAARSERDLHLCTEREVCSVLHRRFWGAPPMIERFCRCPGRLECPSKWGDDDRSMHLNTRAQLKFCKDLNKLKKCHTRTAITLKTRHTPSDEVNGATITKSAVAHCKCPGPPAPRMWHHRSKETQEIKYANRTIDVIDTYACSKLPRCELEQMCGHVRADLFSAYYHCSCPKGSLCVSRNEEPNNVSEMLFHGLAYRAHCTRYPHINMIN